MTNDDRAKYLATGKGEIPDSGRLDMIRGLLSDPGVWTEPPSGVVDGIGAITVHESDLQPSRSRRLRVPLVVAAAAVSIAILGILGVFDRPVVEPSAVANLTGTELMPSASGTATVRDTSSGWAIRLELEGLPGAPAGSFYQGWAWSQEGEGVSIGTFHLRGGDYPVTLWAGVELSEYPWIWVTLQEEGAGPEASGLVLLRGRIDGLDR